MWWQKRPFEKVSRFLRTEVRFFEALDVFAKRILQSPRVNAVFMGHTHCEQVRAWPHGKIYVNTGAWMPIVNLNLSNLGQNLSLNYGLVRWTKSGPPRVSLMKWHGQRPVTEEVAF